MDFPFENLTCAFKIIQLSLASHPFVRQIRRLSIPQQRRFVQWVENGLYLERKGLGPVAATVIKSLKKKNPRLLLTLSKQLNLADLAGAEQTIKLKFTYLRRALDTFLAIENLLIDQPALHRRSALHQQHDLNFSQADKSRKRSRRELQKPDYSPHDAYLVNFLLDRDETATLPPGKVLTLEMIQRSDRELDHLFMLHKLQFACRYLAYANLNKKEVEIPLIESVLERIEHIPDLLEQHPILALYYYAYFTLSDRSEEYHDKLALLLFNRPEYLKSKEVRELFVVLLNYSNTQMNIGRTGYTASTLELYKVGLKEKVIFTEGRLTGTTFMNIVLIAIKLRQFDWAEDFLRTQKVHLSARDQEQIYQYCLAIFCYETGQLALASDLLVHYDAQNSQAMYLQARIALVRVYYDQEEFELLDNLFNSLTVYISRSERLGYHGEIYLLFIRACKRLANSPFRLTQEQSQKLRAAFVEIPVKSMRDWLVERLEKRIT